MVRVDGKRRLTITDRRKPTPSGKALRLNKTTFQLPKTANPDTITGCFVDGVLTFTVPKAKGQQQPAVTVATKEEAEPDVESQDHKPTQLRGGKIKQARERSRTQGRTTMNTRSNRQGIGSPFHLYSEPDYKLFKTHLVTP